MATPKGGNFGKVLEIDLSKLTYKTRPVSDEILQQYIGARGLGAYYAVTEYKAGKNPLDEDAFVFVGPGPLAGTMCVSPRTSIVNKNPYTGLLNHGECGAHLASEIKWAGWDGIYIKGRAKKPVWFSVVNDKVEFRDASKMWGKTTDETHEMMIKEMKDSRIRSILIGPAGENGVFYSCLIVERFRAAARSNAGSVFGDKKLKGFAIRGTKYAVPVVDNAKFLAAAQVAKETNISDPGAGRRKVWGTASSLETNNFVLGSLIVKNFQTTWWPDIVKLGAEEAERKFWKRHVSCTNCQTHCLKLGVLREGKYKGLIAEAPEYESGGLLGIEPGHEGLRPDDRPHRGLRCLRPRLHLHGRRAGLHDGSRREGRPEAGGPRRPEAHVGRRRHVHEADRQDRLQGRKGREAPLPGCGPDVQADRQGHRRLCQRREGPGACGPRPAGRQVQVLHLLHRHQRRRPRRGGKQPRSLPGGHERFSLPVHLRSSGVWGGSTDKIVVDMLNPLCGWNWKTDEYWMAAKRIITAERVFNVREGISAKDDRLPKRMYAEKLPAGPKKGVVFTGRTRRKRDRCLQVLRLGRKGHPDGGHPSRPTASTSSSTTSTRPRRSTTCKSTISTGKGGCAKHPPLHFLLIFSSDSPYPLFHCFLTSPIALHRICCREAAE